MSAYYSLSSETPVPEPNSDIPLQIIRTIFTDATISKLGSGAFNTVWKVESKSPEFSVAVKVSADDMAMRGALLVTYYEGLMISVMPLAQRVDIVSLDSIDELLAVVQESAGRQQKVHGDIHPGNLFFMRYDQLAQTFPASYGGLEWITLSRSDALIDGEIGDWSGTPKNLINLRACCVGLSDWHHLDDYWAIFNIFMEFKGVKFKVTRQYIRYWLNPIELFLAVCELFSRTQGGDMAMAIVASLLNKRRFFNAGDVIASREHMFSILGDDFCLAVRRCRLSQLGHPALADSNSRNLSLPAEFDFIAEFEDGHAIDMEDMLLQETTTIHWDTCSRLVPLCSLVQADRALLAQRGFVTSLSIKDLPQMMLAKQIFGDERDAYLWLHYLTDDMDVFSQVDDDPSTDRRLSALDSDAVGRFYQFNTPLTVIIGNVDTGYEFLQIGDPKRPAFRTRFSYSSIASQCYVLTKQPDCFPDCKGIVTSFLPDALSA